MNKLLNDIPSSKDNKFWGEDSQKIQIERTKPISAIDHYLVWQDGVAICTSCPNPHTIPLDTNLYQVKDGTIVKKDIKIK